MDLHEEDLREGVLHAGRRREAPLPALHLPALHLRKLHLRKLRLHNLRLDKLRLDKLRLQARHPETLLRPTAKCAYQN